jgi:hypothetical protein
VHTFAHGTDNPGAGFVSVHVEKHPDELPHKVGDTTQELLVASSHTEGPQLYVSAATTRTSPDASLGNSSRTLVLQTGQVGRS